jgi:hypothetical protein
LVFRAVKAHPFWSKSSLLPWNPVSTTVDTKCQTKYNSQICKHNLTKSIIGRKSAFEK